MMQRTLTQSPKSHLQMRGLANLAKLAWELSLFSGLPRASKTGFQENKEQGITVQKNENT